MLLRPLLLAAALLGPLGPILSPAEAQHLRPRRTESLIRPRRVAAAGMITERLSVKGLQRWQSIERLAFAEDAAGQPLYPTLRGLWEWVEASGHAVYIELVNPSRVSTCTAGSFSIERFDPQGVRHRAVIRLHLSNIDQAYVGPGVARADGFIPFDGLQKEERYAEVLGHELAHAVWILGDLRRAEMVEEVIEQTNELLLSNYARRLDQSIGQEMRRRLINRDSFLKDLEAQAESMEVVVWRELVAARRAAAKHPTPAGRPSP